MTTVRRLTVAAIAVAAAWTGCDAGRRAEPASTRGGGAASSNEQGSIEIQSAAATISTPAPAIATSADGPAAAARLCDHDLCREVRLWAHAKAGDRTARDTLAAEAHPHGLDGGFVQCFVEDAELTGFCPNNECASAESVDRVLQPDELTACELRFQHRPTEAELRTHVVAAPGNEQALRRAPATRLPAEAFEYPVIYKTIRNCLADYETPAAKMPDPMRVAPRDDGHPPLYWILDDPDALPDRLVRTRRTDAGVEAAAVEFEIKIDNPEAAEHASSGNDPNDALEPVVEVRFLPFAAPAASNGGTWADAGAPPRADAAR